MNKFVTALLRLLGGLMAAVALALPVAARPQASPQEPIPYPIWTIEEIATGGYLNTLALDSLDRPHLLYQDSETWAVHYATRGGDAESPGEWQLEDIITTPGHSASYTYDIAIRPDDTPCLVYAIAPSVLPLDTALVYGCRGPEGWELDEIDDGGRGAQLAFDATGGTPHIALAQGQSVVYLTWQDDHWGRDTVATDSSYIGLQTLAFTSDGRPHVVYAGSGGAFAAVLETNGVWTKTPIEQAGLTVPRLDANDRLWGLVVHATDMGGHPPMYLSELFLARPDDAGEHTLEPVIDGLGMTYWYNDLAMAGDMPHLASNGFTGDVTYVWWTAEGKHTHNPPAIADGEVKLALGGDGQPRLSFGEDNILRLATRRIVLLDESLALPFIAGSEMARR